MAEPDLELSIQRVDHQSYTVGLRFDDPQNDSEVSLGPRQQARAVFDLDRLSQCLLAMDLAGYGAALTEGLFADDALRTAFAQARASVEHLRLRLVVQPSALELHRLRWELLHDPQTGAPLATDQAVYFSRYLPSLDWRRVRPRTNGLLRVLAVVAAPEGLERFGLAPIDRAGELALLREGFSSQVVDELPRATLPALLAALTDKPYDVLYLVAHGAFRQGTNEPALMLEDEQGRPEFATGQQLIEKFRGLAHRPSLVILASCESAGSGGGGLPDAGGLTDEGDVLSALGPRLAEAGVPAVLAMQGNITMQTVKEFMPTFLSELRKDGCIDRALAAARGLVRDHRPDWWMPALFMRLKTGRLLYTPGFGGPRGFDKWDALLRSIRNVRCTPILGPGLTDALTGSQRELTEEWADQLGYPLAAHERESLPQVAQYRAYNQSRITAEEEWTAQLRAAILKHNNLPEALRGERVPVEKMLACAGELMRCKDPTEPHSVLAGLPVGVYITANTDELLEDALREQGKQPVSMVCPWKEFAREDRPPGDSPADEYDPAGIDLDPDHPLVYHLFGLLSQPETLVLTEDDTFDFLIGITRHMRSIPAQVGSALCNSALLFLGFDTDQWIFRVLLHALLANQGNRLLRRHAHIAAQIEPEEGRLLNPGRARRYLEEYFGHLVDFGPLSDIEINIFWGTPAEFMKELSEQVRGTF